MGHMLQVFGLPDTTPLFKTKDFQKSALEKQSMEIKP